MSPQTEPFLNLYKDAYKAASEAASPTACSVVRAMDEMYCSWAFCFRSSAAREGELDRWIDPVVWLTIEHALNLTKDLVQNAS